MSFQTNESGQNDRSAKLLGAEPQLFVFNIQRACEFYARLGFDVAFVYGEPAFYAQVYRGGARLNLRQLDAPVLDEMLIAKYELLSASVTVADTEALYAEFQGADVEFAQELKTEEWGARTFMVRDADGNLILFAG